MKIIRPLLLAVLAASIILLIAFFTMRIIIQGTPPGAMTIGIIVLLLANIVLCIFLLYKLRSSSNRLIEKLSISYFALIAAFIVFDYIAGQIFLKNVSPMTRSSSTVHHELIPGAMSKVIHVLDYSTKMNVNSFGCRGKELPEIKGSGTVRILMLGDSFTMGRGVGDDETFSVVLEARLNEGKHGKFEVVNCGVESYTPLLEHLQLKEKIDIINPDIVILNFDMSDLVQEEAYREQAAFNDDGKIISVSGIANKVDEVKEEPGILTELKYWIYENMLFTSNIIEQFYKHSQKSKLITIENVVTRHSKKNMLHTLKGYDEREFNLFFNNVKESMLDIKDLCRLKNCDYIISTYPWGHQVNDREWMPGRYRLVPENSEISDRTVIELEKFANKNRIPFINAFPDFRGYGGEELLYFSHDAHWTPKGHEIMAATIKNFLDTNYVTSGNGETE